MATFVVTNTNDQGSGSLRDALAKAEQHTGTDTIVFNSNLAGQTIFLASTLQIKSGNVIISGDTNGDGDADITISGDTTNNGQGATDVGTLLSIAGQATASIASFVFTDGYSQGLASNQAGVAGERGMAGIVNKGQLSLSDSIVTNMVAKGGTGGGDAVDTDDGADAFAGIDNTGTLSISNSYIGQNSASSADANNALNNAGAGGLAVAGIRNKGQLEADGVLFTGNVALGGAGGQSINQTGGDGGAAGAGIWQDAGFTSGYIGHEAGTATGGAYGPGNPGPGENGKSYAGFHAEAPSTSSVVVSNEAVSDHFGGTGIDLINIAAGQNVFALHGNDTIDNRGLDVAGIIVHAGSGNDRIYTGTLDSSFGDTGNDRIFAQGDATVNAGLGNDKVTVTAFTPASSMKATGSAGNDTLDFSAITGQNFKLDMQTGLTSGAATFARFERFIGIDDAGFTDRINGTSGKNSIDGMAGDDILRGQAGNDTLRGGAGRDFLDGGTQNDKLLGGADSDTFKFSKKYGIDVILDFADDVDTILLNDRLWKGTMTKAQVLRQFATLNDNGNVKFDFGNGDKLIIKDVGSIDVLKNDLVII
ncbi:MAG: hypothetical protein KDJ19_05130 [Hyphomicrobiaceae bacterium]|nr:hypothetical protein [Hyphomicrobiaceae bacterium]MCC0024902.1 hypothetical protein [Hyphomicrobiaceae bacterium]